MERQEFSVVVTRMNERLQGVIKSRSVEDSNGCWNWSGSLYNGYGHFTHGGVKRGAHVWSYRVFVGSTNGLCVLHKCDNRQCVNPEHLFLGTQGNNIQDALQKGRMAKKLTADQVRDMRRLREYGLTCTALGKKFNITHSLVSLICNRKTWAHIE